MKRSQTTSPPNSSVEFLDGVSLLECSDSPLSASPQKRRPAFCYSGWLRAPLVSLLTPLQPYIPKGIAIVISPSATVEAQPVKRAFNFNAGPGALPLPVLERIRQELLDWRGSGMSVMEMSHRSKEFESIIADAEQRLRRLLGISEDYAVLFLHGGGSMQFTMAPVNLCLPGKPVDVLHTGMWTAKAIGELKKGVSHNIAASTEAEKFQRVPRIDEIKFSPDASYVHLCSNNTIEGTQWRQFPTPPGATPIVADMSSDIASRPIDVSKFGLIFAGAQKNLGPAGATIVIVRKDLAERADKNLPTLLQYRTHIKEKSLYHTPPTFAIYIVGLVLEWLESSGGVAAIQQLNNSKAKLLYDLLDEGAFYSCPVQDSSRSKMNVVFRVAGGDEAIEKDFAKQAEAAGLVGTPGHRSVGGMRVSLYNAVTIQAVQALTTFMREFQRTRG
jgi:phosphoserine aminotransferase